MRVLVGRYELLSVVGRGGMGEVWQGRDRVIGRRVAVKLMPSSPGGSGTDLFFREARTAGGLSHRGVVTVYDMGQDPVDGTLFLVMEYVSGQDLGAVLRGEGLPAVELAVNWGLQVASALAAAHTAGIVHRDLKPANLMLTPAGEVKVLDFGIARFIEGTDQSSAVMGTLAYMAPERFEGRSGDTRCDLYAFGCVLYELLTGTTPFQAADPVAMMTAHLTKKPAPPGELRAGVPAALEHLVLSLLAKAPADRPTTAIDVHRALRALGNPDQPSAGAPLASVPGLIPPAPAGLTPPAPTPGAGPGASADMSRFPTQPAIQLQPVVWPLDEQVAARPLVRRRVLRLSLATAALAAAGTGVALLPWGGKGGASSNKPVSALDGGTPIWRFPSSANVSYSPVVWSGVLYARRDGIIYAIDSITGRERWRVGAPDANTVGRVAAVDGFVYTAGKPGELMALKSTTGGTAWTFAARNDIDNVTVADGVVYAGSLDKNLYALDAVTGAKKWSFTTEGSILASPKMDRDTLYVGSDDATLYAVNAATGAKKWAFKGGRTFRATPEVADGIVYAVNNDQILYALDANTGAKKWTAPLHGSTPANDNDHPSCPTAKSGMVMVGGYDHLVHAFDAKTGTRKWTYGAASGAFTPTTPAVAGGFPTVYVGDRQDGTIHALDMASGSKQWSCKTGTGMGGTLDAYGPIATPSYLYVANRDGILALATGYGNH
ncbi:PQQ-binding-like beta-propeller repeat protein [Streptomyces sp. NPDC052000]|uniref:protein kinase domain-containing protein n=1 Tax=Streptomyces sp. NPDC052000 TaxID=3155676 RepID=UPI00344E4C2A